MTFVIALEYLKNPPKGGGTSCLPPVRSKQMEKNTLSCAQEGKVVWPPPGRACVCSEKAVTGSVSGHL